MIAGELFFTLEEVEEGVFLAEILIAHALVGFEMGFCQPTRGKFFSEGKEVRTGGWGEAGEAC